MIAIQTLTLEKECLFPRASLGTFKNCILCNYSKYIFLFKNLIFITSLRISCSVFLMVLPSPIQFPPIHLNFPTHQLSVLLLL